MGGTANAIGEDDLVGEGKMEVIWRRPGGGVSEVGYDVRQDKLDHTVGHGFGLEV